MGITSTPSFETHAEQYKWLNSTIAVGIGKGGAGVMYDIYAVSQDLGSPSRTVAPVPVRHPKRPNFQSKQ